MAKRASTPRRAAKPRPALESLLEERQTITKWLARLSASPGGDATDDVRTKVQIDYEARLKTVGKHLQGYAEELRDTLTKQTVKQGGLLEKEDGANVRLAEAKLRHSVGEYSDDQWNKLNAEIQGELGDVRKQLKVVQVEVTRLDEVITSIDKMPEDDGILLTELESAGLGDAGELKIIATGMEGDDGIKMKRPSGQADAFDDLEFLKKMAPETGKRRRSALFKPTEVPDVPDKPKPTPEPPEAKGTEPEKTSEIVPEEDDTARKTLKCAECGAMNCPTEWYCESCGAELAAV